MKITDVKIYPLAVPRCDKPYNVAYGKLEVGAHVVIRIETDEGVYGWGETSPLMRFYPETLETTYVTLKEHIRPLLIGRDPFQIAEIIIEMDKLIMKQFAAKAAVDLALHDIMGKALNVPVYKLLGGSVRDLEDAAEYDLTINTLDETAKEAKHYYDQGVRSFEIKMGLDLDTDVQRVRVVREAVGADAHLRVDMNEGYNIATAKRFAWNVRDCDLQYMEQPLPMWNHVGLAELRRYTCIPICADQAAYTPVDVAQLIKLNAADYYCIKIARSGFFRARGIAAMCEANGTPNTLGHMLPLGIGTRAIHHFAKATKNVALDMSGVYASPFDYWKVDIVKDPIEVKNGTVIVPEDKPGLGVEVDEKVMKKYLIDK